MEHEGISHTSASTDTASTRPVFVMLDRHTLYGFVGPQSPVRPPLLSDWEQDRVRDFRSANRRDRWLAGRTVLKAIARERFGKQGVLDVRDVRGDAMLFTNGLPELESWVGVDCRFGQVCAIASDVPAGIASCSYDVAAEYADDVVTADELRFLATVFRSLATARAVGVAIKEAAVKALRGSEPGANMREARIHGDMSVTVAGRQLHVLVLHDTHATVNAVVVRRRAVEERGTRLIGFGATGVDAEGTPEESPVRRLLERSIERARRRISRRAG